MTNDNRVERAQAALEGYEGHGENVPGAEDGFVDLLADLLHLSDVNGWDFDDAVRRARDHYDFERDEAEGEAR